MGGNSGNGDCSESTVDRNGRNIWSRLAALALVVVLFVASSSATYEPDPPAGTVPASFLCAWRQYALEYGTSLRADVHEYLHDALQLDQFCQTPESEGKHHRREGKPHEQIFPPHLPEPDDVGAEYYVSWSSGSDSNSGTDAAHPVKTTSHAVQLSRGGKKPAVIYFMQGTHYIQETVQLGADDSDLAFQNYQGAEAWLSGGWPLDNLKWEVYNTSKPQPIRLVVFNDTSNIGRFNASDEPCAKAVTAKECEDRCMSEGNCTSFTWHDEHTGRFAYNCCLRTDGVWSPKKEVNHISGYKTLPMALNVYVADLSAFDLEQITGLRVGDNLQRVPRARVPNGDPETTLWPEGWFASEVVSKWLPAHDYGNATQVLVTDHPRNVSNRFLYYGVGIGGPCSVYDPPVSYWCQLKPAGGGGFQYYIPSGLTAHPGTVKNWKQYDGAVIQAWRRAHWASWMFALDKFDYETQTLTWTKGGFQGSRGGPGSDWYADGVLDELDNPNEWYYDSVKKQLYFYYNASAGTPPPASLQFVATQTKVLFNISGTQSKPVRNVQFNGLGFRDTAYTYLDPHGVPSGGDWALERMACIVLEGTEMALVNGSKFERIDGNGLILNGYNRNATFSWNDFSWLGSTAMTAWGRTDELSDGGIHGMDGTGGDFPRFTTVAHNIVRELGIWEKQSSAWFQAKSAQTLLMNNVFFNMPRTAVNFNDGFGGGSEVVGNLILNTCRESSDHGPMNSWDRQPFLTTVRTGEPSVIPLYNNLHHNFLVSNYGGYKGGMDNDDGSTFYEVHHNFEVYGWGPKPGGGGLKYHHNVRAYLDQGIKGAPSMYADPSYTNGFYNITAVFRNGSSLYVSETAHCGDTKHPQLFFPPEIHDNTVYHHPSVQILIVCGGKNYTIAEAQQQLHLDPGSRDIPKLPSDEEIISWGKALLGQQALKRH
eukprot:scpid40103/ scgid20017/ 